MAGLVARPRPKHSSCCDVATLPMNPARLTLVGGVARLASVLACAAATATCITDLFTGPGRDRLEISFPGDSLITLGSRFAATVQVTVQGAPLANARLR